MGVKAEWEKIPTQEELDTIKKSVSDGKQTVAAAITAKGVTTAATATFDAMANNVRAISTGTDTSDATATAARILSGYTAYAKGVKLTGTYNPPSCPTLSSMTSDATATAARILSGYTAYVKGSKITGTYNPPSAGYTLKTTSKSVSGANFSDTWYTGLSSVSYVFIHNTKACGIYALGSSYRPTSGPASTISVSGGTVIWTASGTGTHYLYAFGS